MSYYSPETCPIGNREFFLITLVLIGVTAIFPPIAFLTVLLAIPLIVGWLLYDVHGFLSIVWRIFLGLLLLASIVWLCLYHNSEQYHTQVMIAGSVGLLLSLSGLVRSFFFKKA